MKDNTEENKGAGRPTKFKEEYIEQVNKLCMLGATDKFIGEFFGVTETTVNNWKIEHPEFFESLKRGKMVADMEVAESLYKSCFDRQIEETTAFKVKNVFYNKEGKRIESESIETATITRGVPSDYRSKALWLSSRQPDLWSIKANTSIEVNIPNILQNNPLSNDKGDDSTSENIES